MLRYGPACAVVAALAALLLSACRRSLSAESAPAVRSDSARAGDRQGVRYAVGFSIAPGNGFTLLTVRKPWQGARADFSYALVERAQGNAQVTTPPGALRIEVPARRVLALSTTELPDLQTLGVLGALVGVGSGRYVCNAEVRARLAAGSVRDVGDDMHLDLEAAVQSRPDVVFAFGVGNGVDAGPRKLQETGLPVALDGSYMEETPLGRAEWIKFTAAFFGEAAQARADSAFDAIEKNYLSLAALARGAARRPSVLVSAPFGGVWWVSGGHSYMARLIADAGAHYLWDDDTTRGSLLLNLEAVLARGGEADVWINPGTWRSLADGRRQDARLSLFKPFREHRVYNGDALRCGDGIDLYETGSSRPDVMLADLIALFHPELLPDHHFHWYRRLEDR